MGGAGFCAGGRDLAPPPSVLELVLFGMSGIGSLLTGGGSGVCIVLDRTSLTMV